MELIPAGGRGGELLAALGAPLHGTLQHLGCPYHHRLIGLDANFHAEAAADVANNHAYLVLGHLEHDLGQGITRDGGILAADMDNDPVAVPFGHHRARFHGIDDQPLVDDVERHDMGRCLERGVRLGGIAETVEAHDVARSALPHLRCAGLQRILDLGHGRQLIVLDLDQLDGILRLFTRLGHNRHHRFADVAHGFVRQRRARRHLGHAAVGVGEHGREREITGALLGHVIPGENRNYARRFPRRGRVDADDFRMRVRRPDQDQMGQVRTRQIIRELAGSRQKPVVLDALDILGLAERRHTLLLPLVRPRFGRTIAARRRPTTRRDGWS